MTGNQLTQEQLTAAEIFILELAGRRASMDGPSGMVTMQFEALVRMVAWYGAIRFKAGRDGTGGTLEAPGPTARRAPECLCIVGNSVNGECPLHGDEAQKKEKTR